MRLARKAALDDLAAKRPGASDEFAPGSLGIIPAQ
jgi:hypothetical protein